ncbi:peroxisomal membrane protein-domain-containing protein [Aspergillus alliaceus]|uniref:Peroxisomal membrane protein-domain-containing protein n=1 Tax=Petromyces alliaceus TaxID=209559 RepID=A0A5N7BU38_PETAA|nr:peroxisomal membrane protein-domain-containing protein [Aspergillus alliaceus]
MDILNKFHASVTQSLESSFNNAYSDFNDLLVLHDAKVAAAEGRLKVAEDARSQALTEIEQLKVKVIHLRKEISRGDISLEDAEAPVSEPQLEETYAPQRILNLPSDNNPFSSRYGTKEAKVINEKYVALYGDAQTLVKAYKGLRRQIMRHKRKLEHWRTCLERDEFTLVLNGVAVKFQRVKSMTSENQNHSPTVESMSTTVTSELDEVCPPGISEQIKGPKKSPKNQFQTESLAASSTQFDPSCSPEETDTSTQQHRALKRKRGLLSEPGDSASHSSLEKGGSKQDIAVKSQSMSSGPIRSFPQHSTAIETPTREMDINRNPNNQIRPSTTNHSSSTRAQDHDFQRLASGQRFLNNSVVLQPADNNTRFMHDTARWPEKGSSIVLRRAANHAISSIAEDGEQVYSAAHTRKTPWNTEVASLPAALNTQDVSTRLEHLLEEPLSPKQPLRPQKDTETVRDSKSYKKHRFDVNQPALTENNPCLIGDLAAIPDSTRASKQPSKQQGSTGAPTSEVVDRDPMEMHPEEEPYRARPLHRLELSHFRINPDCNEGLEYAFDAVVRNRDKRKCIRGCTRPECCGEKFLAMARLGGLRTDPTVSSHEEQRILEEYLGEEIYLLEELTGKGRQDLLTEAKARLIADRFGKHRNHHQRPATPPGFWRTDMPNTQELELDLHTCVQLLSLYHDSLVSRVISRLPLTIPRLTPTPHSRYTKYWTSHSSLYHKVALTLQMVQYTELLWEMVARRRGEKVRWRIVVLIEAIKAICRLFLLRLTNSRPLVSPPLPERDVDPRSAEEEESDWNGMHTPVSERSSDLSWTMPRTGLSLPSLPDVNDVSSFLISKVLTADDIKPPKALLHRVTGQGQLAELLYILRPVAYALAMQRWHSNKRSWRPWLIGFGMEYGCRQLAKADFRERLAGGLRGLTGLEREELRKRGWAMGWWFMRGAFYEHMTRSWLKGLTGKMKGKPLLDLVGSVIEDYEYLWDNYYFATATL